MSRDRMWYRRCKRLTRMSVDEWRVRLAQEAAKRWDLVFGLGRAAGPAQPPRTSGRFFFEHDEVQGIIDFLRGQLSQKAAETIVQAEEICAHRFDLLGYKSVEYGKEIDWHCDPIHNKRAPDQAWFRIPYLNFEEVGDCKITWELNRHQHLVTLAKAYRLTGDSNYVQELLRQWYHWQKHNPYGVGINWSSSLEVALRSLSWIWVLHLLNQCSIVPGRFPADLGKALITNARHIARFRSTYFSPNTHLLGEAVALFFIGTLFLESPQARSWQELGWQIILQEAGRQVQPDGTHFEQSVYYHVYALDFFLHARILAARNGVDVPQAFDEVIARMLQVLSDLAKIRPLMAFGDDDGGRVFDPHRNRLEHLVDPLSTGAVLFENADFKHASGVLCEETLWLCGVGGADQFARLPAAQGQVTSFALESSGLYVMRSSSPVLQQLVMDVGSQAAGRPGHGHADALSVQVSVNGRPLLIDPGTFVYVSEDGERDRFRGTAAHNTVRVDGVDQADPAGPFGWYNLPSVNVEQKILGKNFDLISGSHNGYTRLASPVVHQRCVFYLKSRFWLVRDIIDGQGWHDIEALWHFAPAELSLIPGGARFRYPDQEGLVMLFSSCAVSFLRITEGSFSAVYGQKKVSPLLRIGMKTHVPVELATLLIPVSGPDDHYGRFTKFEEGEADSQLTAYVYSSGADENHFVFSDRYSDWQLGPWASNARMMFCSMDSNEALTGFILCEGSYLEFRGQRVFTAADNLARAEWFQQAHGYRFSCSDSRKTMIRYPQVVGLSNTTSIRAN